ncbi:MAG TPA: DUF222 domain-containing protein [Mycobacteriales bacterium]|nr:DUF222 domain-containing protein [Mycobacteriales bacterium]
MFEDLGPVALAAVLAGVDPAGCSDAELLAAVVGFDRLAGWVSARSAACQLALYRRLEDPDIPEAVTVELAAALRASLRTVDARLTFAGDLGRLEGVAEALAAGRIGWAHAHAFVEELRNLESAVAVWIAGGCLEYAAAHTPGQLRRMLRRRRLLFAPWVPQFVAVDPELPARRLETDPVRGRLELTVEP